jgi:hypothetical protein
MDSERERIEKKLLELVSRFEIKGWVGPCHFTPEETVKNEAHEGRSVAPLWQVFVYREGIQNTEDPEMIDGVVRVRFRFSEAQMEALSVEELALRLTIAVAAREAHEVLECALFDDALLLDPHNESALSSSSDLILECLRTGAG